MIDRVTYFRWHAPVDLAEALLPQLHLVLVFLIFRLEHRIVHDVCVIVVERGTAIAVMFVVF